VKGNVRFWVIAGAVVVALLVFHAVLVSPTAKEAEDEAKKIKNLAARRKSYFDKSGRSIGEASEFMKMQKTQLEELSKIASRSKLLIPAELLPKKGRDMLYVQQQVAAIGSQATAAGVIINPKLKNLGISRDGAETEIGDLLARVAVAKRFYGAVRAAGVRSLVDASMPEARLVTRPDATVQVEELPYKVTVSTDERGLIRLVQELSVPRNFLALKGVLVEVTDPASGAFDATLEVAGLRTKRVAPQEDAPKETPGTTPVRRPGTPMRPRRFP